MWRKKDDTKSKEERRREMSDEEFEQHIGKLMKDNKSERENQPSDSETEPNKSDGNEQKTAENPELSERYRSVLEALKVLFDVLKGDEANDVIDAATREKISQKSKAADEEISDDSKNADSDVALAENTQNEQPADENTSDVTADTEKKDAETEKDSENQRQTAMRLRLEERMLSEFDNSFSLPKEYATNPEFRKALAKSGSVYYAYLSCLGGRSGSKQGSGRTYKEVGAIPGGAAGRVNTTPAKLPEADFDKYIKKIMGEM